MYDALENVRLKSGETVEAGVVTCPDADWMDRIRRLLYHKGDPWNWQNYQVLKNELGIEVRYYLLHRSSVPFANVMTVELGGVGLFGHVWTVPGDRRKGACAKLLDLQMSDFRARGGRALFLSTGFESPAYAVYKKMGFHPIEPKSGYMAHYVSSRLEFEAEFFAEKEATVQALTWRHWPTAPPLFMADFPGRLRCAPLGIIGRKSTEGSLLKVLQACQSGTNPARRMTAVVLESETTAVVGLAAAGRHPVWASNTLVDVYCHPNYWDKGGELLRALELPDARPQLAYSDIGFQPKCRALFAAGFRQTTVLKARIPKDAAETGRLDVAVFER